MNENDFQLPDEMEAELQEFVAWGLVEECPQGFRLNARFFRTLCELNEVLPQIKIIKK